jgi:hypothetical protein
VTVWTAAAPAARSRRTHRRRHRLRRDAAANRRNRARHVALIVGNASLFRTSPRGLASDHHLISPEIAQNVLGFCRDKTLSAVDTTTPMPTRRRRCATKRACTSGGLRWISSSSCWRSGSAWDGSAVAAARRAALRPRRFRPQRLARRRFTMESLISGAAVPDMRGRPRANSPAPPPARSGRPAGECRVEGIDDADWRNRVSEMLKQAHHVRSFV